MAESNNRAAKAAPVRVKSIMHIDSAETPAPANDMPVLDRKPRRNARFTEVITTHHFPGLLPFGTVTLRVANHGKWAIKCGSVRMTGWGGEVDEIVKAFVNKVRCEIRDVAAEVENESFTTEPSL